MRGRAGAAAGAAGDSEAEISTSSVTRRRSRLAQLGLLLLDQRLAAELDAIAFDGQNLDHDLIALAQLVLHFLDAMLGNLGDVQQAVGAGEELDKRAELRQPNHLAQINLADLRHRGEVADDLQSLLQSFGIAGSNIDPARVVHIDLGAGLLDDAADGGAALADQIANLVGGNHHGFDARRISRTLGARSVQHRVHLVQQEEPAPARLLHRLLKNLAGQPADLDVHLQRGDALARSGHLEVHVAVVILRAGDVGEDGVIVALLHQSHRHAGHCALERDARVKQRQTRAADRGHRRRAVRFENVADDADGVRRLFGAGQNRADGALGQCSVAHLAPSRAAHAARLAHAEGREVVVQHEGLLLLAFIAFQPLAFVGGAQRGRHQGLRLAAGKQRRAVRAGQNAGLDGDLANLVEGAAVGPDALLGHLLAEDPLAQLLIVVGQLLLGARIVGGQLGGQLVLDRLDQRLALQLVVRLGIQRVLEPVFDLGLQFGISKPRRTPAQ